MKKFYITTPIYYVNAAPHIGTAYNALAADTLARYWRTKIGAENVHFLTGTDENSQKTIEAAEKKNQSVDAYLDEMAGEFRNTWDKCGLEYDDFIRTTESRHHAGVGEIFRLIKEHNPDDVYMGEYKGLYCTGCEAFYKEEDLTDGKCPDHKTAPQEIIENNYFFRLSAYTDFLKDLLNKEGFLLPESRKNEMLAFIDSGLEDISITRETAKIGIPFPWDTDHRLYVWVEALMNYYSAIWNTDKEAFWPHAFHFIGKDITRFHSVIWPAILASAGLPLPEKIFGHGFFTVDGTKMSKSLGNVIHPLDLASKYGKDALRLGLLSSFELGSDGDFSMKGFDGTYNSKLAGGVGNLFSRVIKLGHKLMNGKVPETKPNAEMIAKFEKEMEHLKVKKAYETLSQTVDRANEILNEREPWKRKDDAEFVRETFKLIMPFAQAVGAMAESLLPEKYPEIIKMLGQNGNLGEPVMLYPRVQEIENTKNA